MRRIFCRFILLTIILVTLAGCYMLERIYLKGPTIAPSQEFQEVEQPTISNDLIANSVKDMLERIDVRFSTNNTNKDISAILQDCLSFLANEFGPPVYRGRVILDITDDPADNAFMMWSESGDVERQITLNHYNVMKPIWHHYLVHELFHAFYQSGELLRVNPDIIIEGLAIYAQYRYQNRGMNNDQVRDKIYEDAAALRSYSSREGIDFDRSFQSYGERERKYIYLVSGLLFFNQDPENIKEKIRKILWAPELLDEKIPFNRIVTLYDLATDDEMFKLSDKKELALPEPKEVNLDLYEDMVDIWLFDGESDLL